MKHQQKQLRNIGDGRMNNQLRLGLFLALAFVMSTGFAQSFYGFASYQDYLNNYYGQSAYQAPAQNPAQIRSVVYTPYTTPNNTPTTVAAITAQPRNTDPYNGFPSYQAYLDNFYGGQNVPSPSVDPCGFAQTMSIFVSPNNDCAPVNPQINPQINPQRTNVADTTTPFNGYPSYQAYLDAFYANQGAPAVTTPPATTPAVNTSATSGYYGYNSYEEYLQAFYALNNTGSATTSSSGTSPSGYNVDYTVTQTSTAPPRTTSPTTPEPQQPSTNVSGYFDFVIGQAYQFSNGLIMTVETLTDSRCPQGVQCVWQGNIASTVRLEKDAEDERVNVSIVEGQQAPRIVVENASVQFVGLGEIVDNTDTLKAYIIIN